MSSYLNQLIATHGELNFKLGLSANLKKLISKPKISCLLGKVL